MLKSLLFDTFHPLKDYQASAGEMFSMHPASKEVLYPGRNFQLILFFY